MTYTIKIFMKCVGNHQFSNYHYTKLICFLFGATGIALLP